MNIPPNPNPVNLVAIDVSSDELVVMAQWHDDPKPQKIKCFANDTHGHQALIAWASSANSHPCRFILESTGSYSTQISLTLHQAAQCQVMLVHSSLCKHFAGTCKIRAKTDSVDAALLLEFLKRMPFVPYQPPLPCIAQLKALSHRASQLKKIIATEKNHRHAAELLPDNQHILDSIEHSLQSNNQLLTLIEQQIQALFKQHQSLKQIKAHLCSIKGIADRSAACILAEVLHLPQATNANQWVAYAGLDPRPVQSGKSIDKHRCISKQGNFHLRKALYMPALVAIRSEPVVKAYYQDLLLPGKAKMQALVAVMRKLIRSIYAMIRYQCDFDPSLFSPAFSSSSS